MAELARKLPDYISVPGEGFLQSLIEHGQFTQEEIDEIFNQHSYESTDYTDEFIENHPEIDFLDRFTEEHDEVLEVKYNFPHSDCLYKDLIGFCRMEVEVLACPDCNGEITNTPDNVTFGYEHDLVCPKCLREREDEFDMKGLVKAGWPAHHGQWDSQEPEFVHTGTDYFAVLHPRCARSQRDDKKGYMEVSGIWMDDCGRVVLSLECKDCGARNALKPLKKNGVIPLLNESGAAWERVYSAILRNIEMGESERNERKAYLRWDYKTKRRNRRIEYKVARAIAAFMNRVGGGVVLIGVEDSGKVIGIEKDCSTLGKGKKNRDGFELQLTEKINEHIGKEFRHLTKVEFGKINNKDVCQVEVTMSPKPVFLKENKKEVFVVRSGNRTQTLNQKETSEYIKMHWEDSDLLT